MSSPSSDDYAGLMAPWRPITQLSMKSITSPRNKIRTDDGFKEGVVAWADSIDAANSLDRDPQRDDDLGYSNKDATLPAIVADDEVQEASYIDNLRSAETGSPDDDSSIDDGALINVTNITHTDDETSQYIDTLCVAVATCLADSGDHRKVVSHIFGRNKTCTRALPHDLWILWCRKHYQRMKYRAEENEIWHLRQMELVRHQLQIFENWGKVRSWTIALRKEERNALAKMKKGAKMNQDMVTDTDQTPTLWELFLVPYLGANKSFANIREVLDIIQREFDGEEYKSRAMKKKTFPGVEFLPAIHKAKKVRKPAPAKKGENTYKKITLDQPVFTAKTKANVEAKEKAMEEAEASSTPKSSRTPSQKSKSPDTDNQANSPATLKREASTPDIGTIALTNAPHDSVDKTPSSKGTKPKSQTRVRKAVPLSKQHNSQSNKRRRLTRGYEKHGSDDADMMVMTKKEHGDTGDENSPEEGI